MARLALFIFCSVIITLVKGDDKDALTPLTKSQRREKNLREVIRMKDPSSALDLDGHTPRFELAATFGNLTFESVKHMDNSLKIMLGGLVTAMKDMNATSWYSLLDFLDNVPYLKMFSGTRDGFTDAMIQFKKDGAVALTKEVDYGMVYQIESWFNRVIGNPTIIRETKIDIRKMALIAATQVFKYDIENLLVEADVKMANVVDLAVLRFPDVHEPFLQVFVIKVHVERTFIRMLWMRKGISIVVCRFNMVKYRPNRKYIKQLKRKTRKALMKDIEDLFDM